MARSTTTRTRPDAVAVSIMIRKRLGDPAHDRRLWRLEAHLTRQDPLRKPRGSDVQKATRKALALVDEPWREQLAIEELPDELSGVAVGVDVYLNELHRVIRAPA